MQLENLRMQKLPMTDGRYRIVENGDELLFDCSGCGKPKLYVNRHNGRFICFSCGIKGRTRVDSYFTRRTVEQALATDVYRPTLDKSELRPLSKAALAYLHRRKYLHLPAHLREGKGMMEKRIMFPLVNHLMDVVGWTGRAYVSTRKPKYLVCPGPDSSHGIYSPIESGRTVPKTDAKIVLVEGPLDAISIMNHVDIAIAMSGKTFTKDRVTTVSRLISNLNLLQSQVYILLDAETSGDDKLKAQQALGYRGIFANLLDIQRLGAKDPGDMDEDQLHALRNAVNVGENHAIDE